MKNYRFKLYFDGLCAFADRPNEVEAYVLYGHGDHSGTLILRSDFVNQEKTTWQPMTIGVIQEPNGAAGFIARQVGIWSLRGEEIAIVDTAAPGRPVWSNKDRLIEFAKEHAGSSARTKSLIRRLESRVGIVRVAGSGSSLEPAKTTSDDRFVLKKPDGTSQTRECSRSVSWVPTANHVPTIANRAGDLIALREPVDADIDAWACVSNAAPVPPPEGLMHFHHYYIGVDLPSNDPLTIEQGFINVWDCVPTVAWN